MSPPIATATIGGAFAILTAAYANGGRAALQRRVIKQELEILGLLGEDDDLALELTKQVNDRIALYLTSRTMATDLLEAVWATMVFCLFVGAFAAGITRWLVPEHFWVTADGSRTLKAAAFVLAAYMGVWAGVCVAMGIRALGDRVRALRIGGAWRRIGGS